MLIVSQEMAPELSDFTKSFLGSSQTCRSHESLVKGDGPTQKLYTLCTEVARFRNRNTPEILGWRGGEGRFINSQTQPLHVSEEDETRHQGSNSP